MSTWHRAGQSVARQRGLRGLQPMGWGEGCLLDAIETRAEARRQPVAYRPVAVCALAWPLAVGSLHGSLVALRLHLCVCVHMLGGWSGRTVDGLCAVGGALWGARCSALRSPVRSMSIRRGAAASTIEGRRGESMAMGVTQPMTALGDGTDIGFGQRNRIPTPYGQRGPAPYCYHLYLPSCFDSENGVFPF